jgi:ATP-binding cassette subfamily B protein
MIGSVGRLATTNIQLQEAKVAFERMYEFASVEPEINQSNIGIIQKLGEINSLTIKDLSFRFAGKSQLLKDVSLTIRKGEITVLLGEVGSGKSILLQILQKFQTYEAGEVLINENISLKNIASDTWRSKIGVVPQEIKIFNGTLLDNIILGNIIEEGEKAIYFCETLGFKHFFETLPQGYLTLVGEEGINLSGGQKQLLALARALYHQPNILFLDEATSAMDSKTEQFMIDLLEKLKSNLAILIITHNKNIAEIAEDIYELENGMTYQTQNGLLAKV